MVRGLGSLPTGLILGLRPAAQAASFFRADEKRDPSEVEMGQTDLKRKWYTFVSPVR